MIRVLFLIHDLAHGGAEKVLVNLVNNLDKSQFDVTVMALFDGGVNKQFLNSDVKYKYCFKKAIRGNSHMMKLFTPAFLYKKFIRDQYDVLVSYLEGPSARIISGAHTAAKKICWVHCTMQSKEQIAKAFRNYQEAVDCYESMDQMVFVSAGVESAFKKFIPKIKASNVLYNTNETDNILQKAEEEIDKRFLPLFDGNELKLCYVGKLTKNKGIERIAKIHARLHDSGFKVHTYVLGTGEEEEDIRTFIELQGCTKSFSMLGFQVNPYKFIKKCDWFVCSSFAEGFSTAATEALVLGVPVITTDVSGMSELLGDSNEYGIVVENNEEALYEGIVRILQNPSLTAFYKAQAAERGKYFSKERTVKAVENFLKCQV